MAAPGINDFTTTNPDSLKSTSTSNYPPSHTVAPTQVDTAPQQGSTAPGDGHQVHTGNVVAPQQEQGQSTGEVPFKERVIGVAQKTRGTLFGDQGLKEHGEAILDGRTTYGQEVQERRRQD